MWNFGIGSLNCWPVIQIPVVSKVIIPALLAGGKPAILGTIVGQSAVGVEGWYGTGAPASHRLRSSWPLAVRGVWQVPHMATFSTMY
jgi:hypothetical protein